MSSKAQQSDASAGGNHRGRFVARRVRLAVDQRVGVLVVALCATLGLALAAPRAEATHGPCHYWYGTSGNDSFSSNANQCDIMYMYGGDDMGRGGPYGDNLYMDAGADTAYGEDGRDYISGGDNGTSYQDQLRGQSGNDIVTDSVDNQNDNDLLCGGDGTDDLDSYDLDVRDYVAGGPGSIGQVQTDQHDVYEPQGGC